MTHRALLGDTSLSRGGETDFRRPPVPPRQDSCHHGGASTAYDPPSRRVRKLRHLGFSSPFSRRIWTPLQNAAWTLQGRRHQADYKTQSVVGPAGAHKQHPTIPPRSLDHNVPVLPPAGDLSPPYPSAPLPSAVRGREDDAYLSTAACRRPVATRNSSLMRNTSLPRGASILDAISTKRAQKSGSETAATRHTTPNLHWRNLMYSADKGSFRPGQ